MAAIIPKRLLRTVTLAVTPEVLGAETTHLYRPVFVGRKAADTVNSGNVTIQVKDADSGEFADALIIESDSERAWPIDGFYKASDFKIKVATNGDGVLVVFGSI